MTPAFAPFLAFPGLFLEGVSVLSTDTQNISSPSVISRRSKIDLSKGVVLSFPFSSTSTALQLPLFQPFSHLEVTALSFAFNCHCLKQTSLIWWSSWEFLLNHSSSIHVFIAHCRASLKYILINSRWSKCVCYKYYIHRHIPGIGKLEELKKGLYDGGWKNCAHILYRLLLQAVLRSCVQWSIHSVSTSTYSFPYKDEHWLRSFKKKYGTLFFAVWWRYCCCYKDSCERCST